MRTIGRFSRSWFVLTLLMLIGASGALHPAGAQTASLVRDINTALPQQATNVNPQHLVAAGRKVFFESAGGIWVSDGTSAGTLLLREQHEAKLVGSVGSTVFWMTPSDGAFSAVLWRSDGTRPGTFALAGGEEETRFLSVNTDSGHPAPFFAGRLWFTVCQSLGCSLWSTDGTTAGTNKSLDLSHAGMIDLIAAGTHLFFRVPTDSGQDLLATDGTPGNTVTVAQLGPNPGPLAAAGNRLFFLTASDGSNLWVSDGTPEGTGPLTHFPAPSPVSGALVPIGGRVYFAAQTTAGGPRDLWVTDGTVQGTKAVTHFTSGGASMRGPGDLAVAGGGRLVFAGFEEPAQPSRLFTTNGHSTARLPDPASCPGAGCLGLPENLQLLSAGSRVVFLGRTNANGLELWSTDGVNALRMIADSCPGPCSGASRLAVSPFPAGGALVEMQASASGRSQIWSTDGTPQGTKRLTGVPDGSASLDPGAGVVRVGETLFFTASSPQGPLWTTDGTPVGTRLVARGGPGGSSDPRALTAAAGGALFLDACDTASGRRIWLTHGTADSTVPVPGDAAEKPCDLNDNVTTILGAVGGTAIFRSGQDFQELWRTDGTAAGTFPLGQVSLDVRPSAAAFAGRLFFVGSLPLSSTRSLWVSDGTAAGTAVFEDFPDATDVANLTVVGSSLYFTVEDHNGRAVWVSDGTAGGTRPLSPPFSNFPAPGFTALGSKVLFAAGWQIWRTDGTPAGTVPVKNVSFPPRGLTALNGALYFATGGERGEAAVLWRTDGTPAGTYVDFVFPPTPVPTDLDLAYPAGLTSFAGHLFFAAVDDKHGVELWVNDGTLGGTRLLRDIVPGRGSSSPSDFTVAGGRLFFTARDPQHGRELWETDGTTAGTRLVQDLQPLSGSSLPGSLTVIGDRLYFAADDGLSGRELWSLPLTAPAGCQPTAGRLCLSGGRFQVEASWHDFQGGQGTGQAVPLSADTGYFWFFDPANVETVVKVLDGRAFNGHFWTFYGALSNVGYDLTVTDTQTGAAQRYSNPLGQFASVGDAQSFGPLGALPRPNPASAAELVLAETRINPAAALTPCQPSATQLCLEGNRFTVTAVWKDFQGHQGNGTAVRLTGDTGYFWFFDAANLEVVLKALDGTAVNGHHWVFYGALSNVEYTLTVTDTATGTVKTYRNPSGRFASGSDTTSF